MARVLSSSEGTNRGSFGLADWVRFVSVSLIWGSSFLFIAFALEGLSPGLVTLLRVGLGAVTLWLLPAARRTRVERGDWPRILTLSVTWVAVPFTLFPVAQQWVNSALAGMLNGAVPIAAGLLAWAMLGRRPGTSQLAGIGVGLVGVVLISLPSLGGGSEALGVGLILLAAAFYGLSLNLAPPLIQRYGSPALMARVLTLATVWCAPYGLVGLFDAAPSPLTWVSVLVLGVLGTGIAFVLMATLTGSVGSTRASFITYLIPVVALGLGVTIRGDAVTLSALVGVALVVAGSILAARPDPR